MKYIEDYTDVELSEMSHDQYEAMVDLQCARNGAPIIIGEAPVSPEKKIFEKDFTFFEFTGFKCDSETAARIMEAVKGGVFFEQEYSSLMLKVSDASYHVATASPCKGFSEQKYNEIRVEKEAYDIANKEYAAANKEHSGLVDLRKGSELDIRDRFDEAFANISRITNAKAEWVKYLKLSNDDEAIAMNFMMQRYGQDEKFIKSVVPEYFAPKLEKEAP
jgi:hypothetical protein